MRAPSARWAAWSGVLFRAAGDVEVKPYNVLFEFEEGQDSRP
jgi:hypothetical protein